MWHVRACHRGVIVTEQPFDRTALDTTSATTDSTQTSGRAHLTRAARRASGWLAAAFAAVLAGAAIVAPVPTTAEAAEAGSLTAIRALTPFPLPTLTLTPLPLHLAIASIEGATCTEGASCLFTITTSGEIGSGGAAVNYETFDGTAVSDQTVPRAQADFHWQFSGITYGGPTRGTFVSRVPVETFRDGRAEGAETFTITLTSAHGLIIDPNKKSATITIAANQT
jgi:hypothetical protein